MQNVPDTEPVKLNNEAQNAYYFPVYEDGETFIIVIDHKTEANVSVSAYLVNTDYTQVDFESLEYGDKLTGFVDVGVQKLIFEIDIWKKYYFTKFTNENNQLYHRTEDRDVNSIKVMFNLVQFAYDTAIKTTGLKVY